MEILQFEYILKSYTRLKNKTYFSIFFFTFFHIHLFYTMEYIVSNIIRKDIVRYQIDLSRTL